MGSEPNYYQVLGVEPTADQPAIDAAYQGRALRFRLGQLRDRARALPGPSQEEVEQAYAVLGNVEARALYDAAYFPEKANTRRRLPVWLWGVVAAWVAVIAVVCVLGARSRLADNGSAIGQLVATETSATVPTVVAVVPLTETPTIAPTSVPPTSTTVQIAVPTVAPTPTVPLVPTATPTLSTPSLTFRPTATEVASPTATLAPTAPPPTATTAPPPTPVPPTATLEPTATPEPPPPEPPPTEPPPTEPPPVAPTATPNFRATDRIGTSVPVNLRSGPGIGFGTLGSLAPGTLLASTGESTNSGGYLWRRFRVSDGRIGWVRDIDVLPVR